MSKSAIVREHTETLMSIEGVVARLFRQQVIHHDHDALRVIESLIAYYKAIITNFTLPSPKFKSDGETYLYEAIRVTLEDSDPQEVFECLKVIKKSALYWNKERGSQGYLTYISNFI